MKIDGAYRFVKWSMKSFDGINARWKFFIGMKEDGETMPVRGFNISKEDGSLYIHKVQPCDVRRFMCTIERINHKSPKRHFVTLRINRNGKNILICTLPFIAV